MVYNVLTFRKTLLILFLLLSVSVVTAQQRLVVKPMADIFSFVPTENMASVVIISSMHNLNIETTLGERSEMQVNSDSMYVYKLLFNVSEENKRVVSISAPGYLKEYVRVMMQPKQKQYFTVFPPSNEDRFVRYRMVGYSFQGYAPFGVMVAFGKRYGGFVRVNSTFHGKRGFDIESYKTDGQLFNPAGAKHKYNIRTSLTAGAQVAVIPSLFFQLGVGYGVYANQWKKGDDYFYSDSFAGFQMDFGALYNYRRFYINGGVIMLTTQKVILDFHLGIGYVFR